MPAVLDRIATACGNTIAAIEDEHRAIHTGENFDIRELAVETMRRGYIGFTVLLTGNTGNGLPFVACFLTRNGRCIENTFSEYATPDAALAALLASSRAK